jgi:uncharacterized protein
MYELKDYQIKQINSIFGEYHSVDKVILYGFRALGKHRNGSDIDLTIVGKINLSQLFQIENKIDDLLLPHKTDLSVYINIENPALKQHIDQYGKIFYAKKDF